MRIKRARNLLCYYHILQYGIMAKYENNTENLMYLYYDRLQIKLYLVVVIISPLHEVGEILFIFSYEPVPEKVIKIKYSQTCL